MPSPIFVLSCPFLSLEFHWSALCILAMSPLSSYLFCKHLSLLWLAFSPKFFFAFHIYISNLPETGFFVCMYDVKKAFIFIFFFIWMPDFSGIFCWKDDLSPTCLSAIINQVTIHVGLVLVLCSVSVTWPFFYQYHTFLRTLVC